jgi:hypothetical protein
LKLGVDGDFSLWHNLIIETQTEAKQMTKFTKRQYNEAIAANEAALVANAALLESFNDRLEAGEKIETLSDAWNAAHDQTWELEQERHAIEQRWNRRNWTWQDYSEYELVSQNID